MFEVAVKLKRGLQKVLLILIILAFAIPLQAKEKPTWSVYFSPNGVCIQAIVNQLDKAKTSILMQAYSFTSAPIAKALLNAHKRGVKVQVILDKSQLTEQYSSLSFLYNSGIPTKIDAAPPVAHNKVMIIDGETVITRSFNFTRAAEEKTGENLLLIKDNHLTGKYVENWRVHAEHSEVYAGRGR